MIRDKFKPGLVYLDDEGHRESGRESGDEATLDKPIFSMVYEGILWDCG